MEDNIIINTNVFDKCTYVTHCVVEILENTITGETSVGWYPTKYSEEVDTLQEAFEDYENYDDTLN